MKVNFAFCMFDMQSADEREVRQARRRNITSNSQALLAELTKYQCHGRHQHVTLRGWKATTCQVYCDEFCNTVCETITKEKNTLDNTSGDLGRLSLGPTEATDIPKTVNELVRVDPHEEDMFCDPHEWSLDKRMATVPRKSEMQFFRNMKV